LLAVSQAVVPQQVEVPTWNVGDTWAVGAEDVDMTPIFTAITENMQQLMPGISYTMTGKLDFIYLVYKVVGEDVQEYTVSVTENIKMTATIDMSGSVGEQQMSGSMNMVIILKTYGTLYFKKDDLALTRADTTIENMHMTLTGSGFSMGGLGIENINGSADMWGNASTTFEPPLDLFDFPISVGDNWTINSTVAMTGEATEIFSMPPMGEQSMDIPLNVVAPISVSASCPSTKDFTLPDGSTTTAYKIVCTGTGTMGANMFSPGSVVYYSPDSGFIIAEELSFGDAMGSMSIGTRSPYSPFMPDASSIENTGALFALNPMTEQEVVLGASGARTGGTDMTVIAVFVAVVVVVIATVVVLIRRSKIFT
jgi:hypothetical protein